MLHCFVAQIRAKTCGRAGIRAFLRDEVTLSKYFSQNIGTISREMPTNFDRKRLKPKFDIVEKPETRVHRLTDSNVSLLTFASQAQNVGMDRN